MEQFALASIHPRSIAWLIRLDEWDRFEEIIKYNSAMLGGYFNVIIPLTIQDTISEAYQRFLAAYDPDLIVLAPDMATHQLNFLSPHLHPFAIILWESISGIAWLDPLDGGSGINATMAFKWIKMHKEPSEFVNAFIAIADKTKPDTSKLALVACGDIEPRTPMWDVYDGEVNLDSTGYREHFLERLLKPGCDQRYVKAHLADEEGLVPAPDRYQLASLISEEHQFPLSNAVKILETCCKLQYFPGVYQSFIGLTVDYKKGGTPERLINVLEKRPPAIVILVSDQFSLEEAILFWNLRAGGVYVAWLPFLELESNMDKVAIWLDSDYMGTLFLKNIGTDIAFSSPDIDIARLRSIVDDLLSRRQQNYPLWHVVPRSALEFYNYVASPLREESVFVGKDGSKCTFIPKLPLENTFSGMYTVTLKWDGLMLPQNNSLIHNYISSETVIHFTSGDRRKGTIETMKMPKFRFVNNRYLRSQFGAEVQINFNRPFPEQVIKTLFTSAGFSRIEMSSTARYHKNFIDRIGGLEKIPQYLATAPYRDLLGLLADNSKENKIGWLLNYPSQRRAVHHFHLLKVLGKITPSETKVYFDTVSDVLPEEAIDLLEKGLLERGFLLKCTSCSYTSWYPTEHIGQTFECSRCFQTQVYESNPLWLYKLPEVIFQGFEDNMHVPLLALHYLKRGSQHCFEWVPDSNAYWLENDNEIHRNVDILCLCDGKFYIGEAKSNDEIDAEQFSFYENICRRVAVDGIVFATSKPRWGRAVLQRIEKLKTWFQGDIIVLTETELYPNISP